MDPESTCSKKCDACYDDNNNRGGAHRNSRKTKSAYSDQAVVCRDRHRRADCDCCNRAPAHPRQGRGDKSHNPLKVETSQCDGSRDLSGWANAIATDARISLTQGGARLACGRFLLERGGPMVVQIANLTRLWDF